MELLLKAEKPSNRTTMLFRCTAIVALITQTVVALTPTAHTPDGRLVYAVPSGSRIKQKSTDMLVFAPNGTLIHTFQNVIPKGAGTKPSLDKRQELSSTMASTSFTPSVENLLQSFNTTFVVPPAPATFDSQIIYFSSSVSVLHPTTGVRFGNAKAAIQYGGSWLYGTGPFWTYALLVEIPDGHVLQAITDEKITVEVGQKIESTIFSDAEFNEEAPGLFWYIASLPSVSNTTYLEVGWEVPPSVAALQLEEEGVFQASHYPPGPFVFDHINLNMTHDNPAVSWSTSGDLDTNAAVNVDVDGAKDARVSLVF
ncbi:hypothetical protein MIND_01059600 [Mycena indigotica]|uniref:Uncharacterized protein n=1 Tax=Mycena indigotica TaxID=2126181 RepID=A0A8H6SA96_9AGAR|nr:uncharacterized protein MIND_01059600 [Mycena indigotica]KAF7295208.1 hypothetical protein MIND_01059600 [Mycena indigotica]